MAGTLKKRELRAAARSADLRYVSDADRGLARRRRGKSFVYLRPGGQVLRDKAALTRIRALAIPPAWDEVWICPWANGHLQATGRDARGRKQYRYHARWREAQDQNKYERIVAFAKALPAMRRAVARDLRKRGLPREKVLATTVKLLETTLIRVGNDEYARDNRSFGLTTMHDKHVKVRGAAIRFDFRGKHGIEHEIDLEDRRLARIVHACRDLPGQELFQYLDEAGDVCDVGSGDVNDYLRAISGQDFTAKDFRTWAGTALAAQALQEIQDFDTAAAAKRNVTKAIERVAERLGNTQAICRKSYVHPAIIEAYMDRSLVKTSKRRAAKALRGSLHRLSSEEAAVLALLQRRMEHELTGSPKPRTRATSKRAGRGTKRSGGPRRRSTTERRTAGSCRPRSGCSPRRRTRASRAAPSRGAA
ncbi:MAG TPA: DNA topoisomerase IB [Gammaproteobacteria bacterium]|nr:DNA topoisomerase IB [Gammaproteobacteria bacterium]